MKWWIKKRNNPQLGTYYVSMGKMTKKDAREYENALYGSNEMISFDSAEAYLAEIERLKANGKEVMQ